MRENALRSVLLIGLAVLIIAALQATAAVIWPADSIRFDDGERLQAKFDAGDLGGGGGGVNVPTDRNGNGLPDAILIGDLDADTNLTSLDINAGLALMTDTTITLSVGLIAGTFVGDTGLPAPPTGNGADGEIELPCDIDFYGAGKYSTTIQATSDQQDYSVVSINKGLSACADVTIRDLGLDGLKPLSLDSSVDYDTVGRQCLNSFGVDRLLVQDAHIRNCWHDGVLVRGGTGSVVQRVDGSNAGGYGDTNPAAPHAGAAVFYFISDGSGDSVDGIMRDNDASKYTYAVIVRADTPGSRVTRPVIQGLRTSEPDSRAFATILLGGADDPVIDGLVSIAGAGVKLHADAVSIGHFQSTSGTIIRNSRIGSSVSGAVPLNLSAYHSRVLVQNTAIVGSPSGTNGVQLGAVGSWDFENVQISDTGGAGMQSSADLTYSNPLRLTNVTCSRAGTGACLYFPFGMSGVSFHGTRLLDTRVSGIRTLSGSFSNNTFADTTFDSAVAPDQWLGESAIGAFTTCTPALEGYWYLATDATGGGAGSDCSTGGAPPTGNTRNRCRCETGTWTDWNPIVSTSAFLIGTMTAPTNLSILGLDCKNHSGSDSGNINYCVDLGTNAIADVILDDINIAASTPISAWYPGAGGINAPNLTNFSVGISKCRSVPFVGNHCTP